MFDKCNKTLIVLLFISILFARLLAGENERPKIGLVLSGGGARGLAHVGILSLIDSLNIPIDFVVGTSMGGIAGALYAIGYSGEEIEELAIRNDWLELFSDVPPRDMLPYLEKKDDGKFQLEFDMVNFRPVPPSGLIRGQKISLLFSKLT
ncbi:MAG: patatin-like phospholipase family protein, partial [Candidatus Marinimicrobia bacterium]|nr:patatin-like phospholipase family protein [Candidatus Neomarinimicrobiota bacterium]